MLPLTLDDLLPLEEYAGRRREFFDSHRRYIDRYRRVRIGPRVTLIFENRQTLWFRVQEIIRIARLMDKVQVQQELNLYNRLLPGANCLQAALLIDIAENSQLARELATWQKLQGDMLGLMIGRTRYPATLVTCRPEDRCVGAAHWLQFAVDTVGRNMLANPETPTLFRFDSPFYQHQSGQLGDELRQSLLDDLDLSDRDLQRKAG